MTDPSARGGRIALVTGGSRGIGLATARRLEADGHRVAITYRTAPPDDVGSLLAVPCDVTDGDAVEAAFTQVEDELGPVEILVSNAGINRDTLLLMMKEDDFSAVIEANLTGAFRMAKRATKRMLRARHGRIVFMGSIVGPYGSAGQANYAASKAGLIGLARSLARELAPRNITANVIAPGPIETDMLRSLDDEQLGLLSSVVPVGRLGEPAEVAGLVSYLVSDEAGFITGAVVPIDGGLGMALPG